MEDEDFNQFAAFIKKKTAIDLMQYKEAQMKRRLTTLREKRGFATFVAYSEAIDKNPVLFDEFLDRMTINVSEFYRNPSRWEVLEKRFLPQMLQQHGRLKIWSAACSTGEEPYTLAIMLAEMNALHKVDIWATDLDNGVLDKAKEGIYVERSLRDMPPTAQKKYFSEHDGQYVIDEKIKKAIRFEQQNLLADTFQSGYDLIICRNVMIYFTEEAKQLLYSKFAKALKPGGLLFVGSTEQIFTPSRFGLETADTFFYSKTAE